MKAFLVCVAVTLAAVLGLSACEDQTPGPGSALVKWEIFGQLCSEAGVVQVKVTLEQEGEPIITDAADCGDSQLLIEDVPAGTYDVEVLGLDEDGHATYEGSFTGLVVESGADPSSPDSKIQLKQKPGTILLRWSFPEEAGTPCGFLDVETVEVFVLRTDNPVAPEFSGEFPCDPSTADPETLPAPFEKSAVVIGDLPQGDLKVNVFALNNLGDRVYKGSETPYVPMGGEVLVTVELLKCQNGCE